MQESLLLSTRTSTSKAVSGHDKKEGLALREDECHLASLV